MNNFLYFVDCFKWPTMPLSVVWMITVLNEQIALSGINRVCFASGLISSVVLSGSRASKIVCCNKFLTDKFQGSRWLRVLSINADNRSPICVCPAEFYAQADSWLGDFGNHVVSGLNNFFRVKGLIGFVWKDDFVLRVQN